MIKSQEINTACVAQDNISFGIWSQARDLKHLQLKFTLDSKINKLIVASETKKKSWF